MEIIQQASQKKRHEVTLGDDTTYPMTRVSIVPIKMPLCDVFELHVVLLAPSLTKNLFVVSAITDMKCKFEFDEQQYMIRRLQPRTTSGFGQSNV